MIDPYMKFIIEYEVSRPDSLEIEATDYLQAIKILEIKIKNDNPYAKIAKITRFDRKLDKGVIVK